MPHWDPPQAPSFSRPGLPLGRHNTFKAAGSEGLNFAISVDDAKRFVTRPGNKISEAPACKPKSFSSWRSKANDSTVTAYDLTCSGGVNANYIVPDKKSDPIMLSWDRNGDGKPDVIFFDFSDRENGNFHIGLRTLTVIAPWLAITMTEV